MRHTANTVSCSCKLIKLESPQVDPKVEKKASVNVRSFLQRTPKACMNTVKLGMSKWDDVKSAAHDQHGCLLALTELSEKITIELQGQPCPMWCPNKLDQQH